MFDNMFANIGKKIMNYVTIITVIGFAVAIIGGLALMIALSDVMGGVGIFPGFIVMAVGCLLTWINGFVLYGFGKLIDNTEHLSDLKNMQKTLEALNTQVYRMNQANQAEDNSMQNHVEEGPGELASVSAQKPQDEVPRSASAQKSQDEAAATKASGIQLCNETFSFPTRVEEEIFCPNCGTRQKGNRGKCWECSARFVYEDEQ